MIDFILLYFFLARLFTHIEPVSVSDTEGLLCNRGTLFWRVEPIMLINKGSGFTWPNSRQDEWTSMLYLMWPLKRSTCPSYVGVGSNKNPTAPSVAMESSKGVHRQRFLHLWKRFSSFETIQQTKTQTKDIEGAIFRREERDF